MSTNECKTTRKVKLKGDGVLLNMPELLPSELDYSFLERACARNAYNDPARFVSGIKGRFGCREIRKIRLDGINNDYDTLFDMEDGTKFSDCASILPLLTMFMPKKMRKRIENSKKNSAGLRALIESLAVCPECAREDIEIYGESYYHREHCVPGVSVCHKHGCALERHAWTEKNRETPLIPDRRETSEILPLASEYADFVKGLIDNIPFLNNISGKDIQYLMQRRVLEKSNGMDISFEPNENEQAAYSRTGDFSLKTLLTTNNAIEFTAGMFMLVKLFNNPEMFISYARKHLDEKTVRKDIADRLAEEKYFSIVRIVSRNGLRYAELKHNPCGKTFWRGISEFYRRAGECPYCKRAHSTKDGFRKEFEKTYGEKFTLLSEYNSSARAITVGINGTDIKMKDRPGAMKARLDWLMKDEDELKRIIETGVVRNIADEKSRMLAFIEENFREDEPFLSSSLPPSPDLHIIMKGLCDKEYVYRLSTGVYCRSLISLTDNELIDLRYIKNEERRYGFDIGDRFLKEIIPSYTVSPYVRTMVTNGTHLVMHHKQVVQVGNISCNVYRSDVDITEENWKVEAIIAFFRHEDACSLKRDDHFIPQIAEWAVGEGITADDIREHAVNCPSQIRETVRTLMKEVKKICQEK